METQVPFPKFIQALKDMGADIHGAAFLSDPQAAWGALDAELRAAYLLPMGIQDGPEVKLRIGKRAGGKKSLDDVLVTLTGPEFVAPPRPPEPAIDAFTENTIVDVIEVGLSAVTKEEAASLLRKHADEVIYDYSIVLTPLSREKILYYILRDFLGFGKLDPMMRDEFIEDISCDAPGIPIFVYHRKFESLKSTVVFVEDKELDSFVIKMAQRSGKHVSIAEPLLDATLPDGSRLNATLSDEVTAKGSTFTIRKFREEPFTIPDLVRFGTMNEDLLAYWWLAVQNGASAIYAGGTASGKTTSLNAILLFIPPQMKIVSIEDTREINIPHENWIAGVTRSGFGPRDNNGRQAGEIDMFSLLKAALRQR